MTKENTASPHIVFKDILLLRSYFEFKKIPDRLEYGLELVGMKRSVTELEDGSGAEMMCLCDFDLMYGVDDPPCAFTCTYMARYFRPVGGGMSWEDFSDGMALAHVIAYLREFVMNVTTRSMLPRIYINPLNAHALVASYRSRVAEKSGSDLADA